MSDEHHKWQIGLPAPILQTHSAAKHRVFAQYLFRYVNVLTANPRIREFRLTLVDGFAGGGLYRDEQTDEQRYGSPLLMLNAMREAEIAAKARRSKEFLFDVDYFFVESSPTAFPYLKTLLEQSEFRPLLVDKITLLNDEFTKQVDKIIAHVELRGRGNRAIFILDQFGYADVPFSAIQTILRKLDKAEIILTFAVDWLIDYLCEKDSMQRTLEKGAVPNCGYAAVA